MNIINLTPHTLNIYHDGSEIAAFPPSGEVARITMTRTPVGFLEGIPIETMSPGEVTGLPDTASDTMYIVSGMVASAVKRADVFSPGALVRDENGRPVGCQGLVRSL